MDHICKNGSVPKNGHVGCVRGFAPQTSLWDIFIHDLVVLRLDHSTYNIKRSSVDFVGMEVQHSIEKVNVVHTA